ncbi:Lar family restriction alleviation protein [Serratia marcescens]|uniref:Lar family restriction alleviation protein n=1 Tax=Serratia marcescens TaxID=615 RepID=UPI0027E41472|nr:Lar family restriction alleviation protein [Serratia marcescens]
MEALGRWNVRHDNVKPCPFCGARAVTVKEISGHYRAKCGGCEAATAFMGSEHSAIERWNQRTEVQEKAL